jgi:hypothetical protein
VTVSATIEVARLLVSPTSLHSSSSFFFPQLRSKIELLLLNSSISIILSSLVSTYNVPKPGVHSIPSKLIVEVISIVGCL